MEQKYRLKGGVTTQRCWNFNRPKPEEAKIRQLFAPKDNMTGNDSANNDTSICDDSHIRLSGCGLVPL